MAGWWCGVCAGKGWGVVGDSACGAGAPACGGRWIVACGVCSKYAALSNVPFAAAAGGLRGAWPLRGRGDARRDAPWLL